MVSTVSARVNGPLEKVAVAKSRVTYSISDLSTRFSNEDRVFLSLGELDHALVFSLIERLGWQATWAEGEEDEGLELSERVHKEFLEVSNMSDLVDILTEIRDAITAQDLSVTVESATPDITVEPSTANVQLDAPVTVNPVVETTVEPAPTYIYVYTQDGAQVETVVEGGAGGELGKGPGKSKGVTYPQSNTTDDDFFTVPVSPPVVFEDRYGGVNLIGRTPTFNPHAWEMTSDSQNNGVFSVSDLSLNFNAGSGVEGWVWYGGSSKVPTRFICAVNPTSSVNLASNWFGPVLFGNTQVTYDQVGVPDGGHFMKGFYFFLNANGYFGIEQSWHTAAQPTAADRLASQVGGNAQQATGQGWALNHQFLFDIQHIRANQNDTGIIRTTDLMRFTLYRYDSDGTLFQEGIKELNPVVPVQPVPYRLGWYAYQIEGEVWASRAENPYDEWDAIP